MQLPLLPPDAYLLNTAFLRDYINNVAEILNQMGIGHNDRVAIVLPNGPDMVIAFLLGHTGHGASLSYKILSHGWSTISSRALLSSLIVVLFAQIILISVSKSLILSTGASRIAFSWFHSPSVARRSSCPQWFPSQNP